MSGRAGSGKPARRIAPPHTFTTNHAAVLHELNTGNVIDFLESTGRISSGEPACAEELAGGVSNVVLRVTPQASPPLVIKQSREQLRTRLEWRSRLDRIWREVAVMRILGSILEPGLVPKILFEDRQNYLFGMEAIDEHHIVWKTALLADQIDPQIASRLGDVLATLHARTWDNPEIRRQMSDVTVFDELRIDPYYRKIAHVHPRIRDRIEWLLHEMQNQRHCLVLGDFSPKNILMTGDRITLVDFETGHFGDPGFDLGFFLTHLTLKAIRRLENGRAFLDLARRFWNEYQVRLRRDVPHAHQLDTRSVVHWAACVLARIDGKSPVEYLDEPRRETARRLAIDVLCQPPPSLADCFDLTAERLSRA